MDLSPQQQEAFDLIINWYKSKKQTFVLAGYAGTGKTTLAKYIAQKLSVRAVFCAYTGKAAKVLRDKGCPNAGTIHSFLYSYLYEDEEGKPVFGFSPSDLIGSASIVIVDEYSMLSETIYNDLIATGNKVLFLGDPFQLPPVSKDKVKIEPDYFLEEIHRQALDSPILKAATDVRIGLDIDYQSNEGFSFLKNSEAEIETYINSDQVIVGRNVTRKTFNDKFRSELGFNKPDVFMVGEKIICLRNNKSNGLLNGMVGICKAIEDNGDIFRINFECDGSFFENIAVWKGDILGWPDAKYNYKSGLNRFDYGYAITCHKSQGSEFDNVVIYNEPLGDSIEQRRWLYTAITRGRKKVTLVSQNG